MRGADRKPWWERNADRPAWTRAVARCGPSAGGPGETRDAAGCGLSTGGRGSERIGNVRAYRRTPRGTRGRGRGTAVHAWGSASVQVQAYRVTSASLPLVAGCWLLVLALVAGAGAWPF